MDNKGSIKDVSIRVKPSDKLVQYLSGLDYENGMSEALSSYVKDDVKRKIHHQGSKTKNIDGFLMMKKDYETLGELLKKVDLTDLKDELKPEEDDLSDEEKSQTDHDDCDIIEKSKRIENAYLKQQERDALLKDLDANGDNIGKSKKIEKAYKKQNEYKTYLKELDKQLGELKCESLKDSIDIDEVIVKTEEIEDVKDVVYLRVDDLEWLFGHLEDVRKKDTQVPYLHELMEGCDILLPENETVERNPELEARCVKLRRQQMNREYRSMTKGVDNVRVRQPEETIAYQIKHLNRQLIAVGQFILSVAAGFLFGFLGVELMVGHLDFGFRLLLGVMCALVIALAEIYFLAKKLSEDLAIADTVQIGGPPVYPGQKSHMD